MPIRNETEVRRLMKFRIYGLINTFFYKKFAKKIATQRNLVGWCKTNKDGCIVGEAINYSLWKLVMIKFIYIFQDLYILIKIN